MHVLQCSRRPTDGHRKPLGWKKIHRYRIDNESHVGLLSPPSVGWTPNFNTWEPEDHIMDQALIDEFNSRPKSRRGRKPKHSRTVTHGSGPRPRHEDEEMAGSGPDSSSDEDTDEERIEKHTTATRGQKRGKSSDNQSIKRTMKARKSGRKEKSARTSESEEEEEEEDEDVASEVTDPGEASGRASVDVDERRSDASEAVAPPVEVKEEPVEPAAAISSGAHVTAPVAAPAMVWCDERGGSGADDDDGEWTGDEKAGAVGQRPNGGAGVGGGRAGHRGETVHAGVVRRPYRDVRGVCRSGGIFPGLYGGGTADGAGGEIVLKKNLKKSEKNLKKIWKKRFSKINFFHTFLTIFYWNSFRFFTRWQAESVSFCQKLCYFIQFVLII